MKVRPVLLQLSAMLALPGVAVAQAPASPGGSMTPSITCAPLATTPAPPGSNNAPWPPMTEMCTAADPWQSKKVGANNTQDQFVDPVDKPLIERSHGAGSLTPSRTPEKMRFQAIRVTGGRPTTSGASTHPPRQIPK
jgi:hypothetical protein